MELEKSSIEEGLETLLIVVGMASAVYLLLIGEVDAATTLVEMVIEIVEANLESR